MSKRLAWLAGLLLVLIGPSVRAAAPPVAAKPITAAEVQALAEKIDTHIAQRWSKLSATPAERAGDEEYLRRVYLDLGGRIPTVREARAFLRDKHSDKRARLVEQLLTSPRYSAHFTNVYRALLIPEAGNNFQVRLQQPSFESWLKERLDRNAGYDRMVADLVTASLGRGGIFSGDLTSADPGTWFLAKEYKPENLAASTARVFLGVSVECAQCHNHPFASWKREQFWSFAAFYSGVRSQKLMDIVLPGKEDKKQHEITVPGTSKKVKARFLDGTDPKWTAEATTRDTLAIWLTSSANPYFAKATVNRAWAYFFGHGIVEPVDEMVGATSVSSHPELLDLLAREFAGHRFDLKFLIRAMMATKAYQLSSARTHKSQDNPTLFARMPLRGLTGEQLFDSVAAATAYRDSGSGDDLIAGLLGGTRSARSEFLTRFGLSERPTETQTSILQALTLMNGKVTASATSLEKSETLAAIVDAPFATTPERIEALYLAALARKPRPKEVARVESFIKKALDRAATKDSKTRDKAYSNALADVFWALLNSPEFSLNH